MGAMITVATWNINSIKARLPHVEYWLKQHQPDLLLLQEIKCVSDAFPVAAIEAAGYQCTVHGQPAYNGVAVLSREKVQLISNKLPFEDPQARFLDIEYKGLRFLNIYAPNGNPLGTEKFTYKLNWLRHLHEYAAKLRQERIPFLIAGDFNIIPQNIDAKHPYQWIEDALFQPESRQAWQGLCNLGLADAFRALHPNDKDAFTFWDYQAGSWPRNDGIRIDHMLLSPQLADRLDTCWIDKEPRGKERPSDHVPLVVTLS